MSDNPIHEWWRTAADPTFHCVVDGRVLWTADSIDDVYAAGLAPVRVVTAKALAAAMLAEEEE